MSDQDHNIDRYCQFLERLHRPDERPAALTEIKNFFEFKTSSQVVAIIRSGGIAEIINCLHIADKVQVDLTCEVLRLCFSKFEVGDVIKSYTGHVMHLLRHEKACVRRLAVNEVYKCVTSDPGVLPVDQYKDVYVAVAQMVADTDITVANRSILITSNLPSAAYPKVLEEMKIALEYPVSSKCNAFEVVINISCKSSELFAHCTNLGYIEFMVSELSSDDVLYQLNILEFLSNLAMKPYGLKYLDKYGALQSVADLVAELPNDPLGAILTPGYMKFFGCVAHHYPKVIFEKYPVLLDTLFGAFESDDVSVLPVVLDTLGFVGITIEGKLSLAAQGSKFIQTVDKVAQLVKNSANEIKIRALYCFGNLISVDKDPGVCANRPIDHRVTLMTREWFRSLNTRPPSMEILFGICKNPFADIKLAALAVLDAVCQHQWGDELVAKEAGFVEYLLDRSIRQSKQAKESKYNVIKRLVNSRAFDPDILQKLQTYVEQGPFYSENTMQVATEEED